MRASRLSRTLTACSRPLFAAKPKAQRIAADADVIFLQRRQPRKRRFAWRTLVAHPDHRCFEQRDHGRKNLLAQQTRPDEIAAHRRPDRGQRLGEGDHAVEFRLVTHLAPAPVVAVWLEFAGVAAGCLQMPARIG